MINIINENKLIKELLNNKKSINTNTYRKLVAYTKYLKQNGETKKEIRKKLDKLMDEYYDDFIADDWDLTLTRIVKIFSQKKNSNYINQKEINITQNELEFIKSKQDNNVESILFIILVLSKIGNINNELWMNYDMKDVFKLAKFKYNKNSGANSRCEQREYFIYDLCKKGYLYQKEICNSTDLKLLYGDIEYDKNGININLTQDNIEDLIYIYYNWRGDKNIKKCKVCGRYFKIANNSNIYCKKCSKKRILERDRIRKSSN